MKRKIISFISCLMVILACLTGCINYEGYERVDLPNEQLGSVMLPENWEIVSNEGWMTILNTDTEEVIAEELRQGYYINNTDERAYNPKYSGYAFVEYISGSGNSNGGQYSICKYNNGQLEIELKTLSFSGRDSRYDSTFYILQEVSIDILSKIAKSYIRPQNN